MATKKLGSAKTTDLLLLTSADLTSEVTGVLPVANGGTGTGTYTDGQLLIGQTAGNTLTKAAMSGGATMTAAGVVSVASVVIANEASDTTCFPVFVTAATGDLSLKSNAGLTFDSSTGAFTATSLTSTNDATIHGMTVGHGAGTVGTNTVFGNGALAANTTGAHHTAIGNGVGVLIATGSHNTLLGSNAAALRGGGLDLTSISESVLIGAYVRAAANGDANEIVIGYLAEGLGSNSSVIGNSSATVFRAWGTPTFGPTNSLTFGLGSLTAARTLTAPDATGTIALTSNKLSAFAATTSAELAGVISDETGTGALVFAGSPSFTGSPVLSTASATSLACGTYTSSGAMTFTPASGSGFSIALATTGDFAVNTSQLYVDTSTGYVGTGTSSPACRLNVESATVALGTLSLAGLYSQATLAVTQSTTHYGMYMGADASSGNAWIQVDNAATAYDLLLQPLGGNVGVGTTTVSALIHGVKTTEQLRLGYNATEYLSVTQGSGGTCTYNITTAGTARHVFADRINIPTATPASAAATGTTGDICWDASYIYVATATDTWKRAAIATW